MHFAPDALIRLPFYVTFGIVTEVIFTGLWDLINPLFLQSWNAKNNDRRPTVVKRDRRAMGYTFLWMFPIYALLIFIEPISVELAAWPFFARGLVYLLLIWVGEYVFGWLIKKITGVIPWDYSYSRFALHGQIRWDFAVFWFGFGLLVEGFGKKLILLTPSIKSILFP